MAAYDLSTLWIQLLFIVGGAAAMRGLFSLIRQPAVLGDILFGVLAGPSLLGWVAPSLREQLFPASNAELLEALGWIGLVLFMYTAGAEMRWRGTENRALIFVALGGLIVPFTAGLALMTVAHDWFMDGVRTASSELLVALVLSVSALPVLARILGDVNLLSHPIGTITMGAGTIDDLVGWSLLALLAGHAGLTGGIATNLLVVGAILLVALVLDRALNPMIRRYNLETPQLFVVLLVAILGAAWLTGEAGLHPIIGPLVVGAVMSRHPVLRDYASPRLESITLVVFLPIFFVVSGAQADLTLLNDPRSLAAVAVVVLVASAAKVLGAYLGGRAAQMTHPAALVTGILLNARGAVGLVVAKVGYDNGLLSAHGYALLVVMIVVTTALAPPVLQAYVRRMSRTVTNSPA